jgi:hypothetical protein
MMLHCGKSCTLGGGPAGQGDASRQRAGSVTGGIVGAVVVVVGASVVGGVVVVVGASVVGGVVVVVGASVVGGVVVVVSLLVGGVVSFVVDGVVSGAEVVGAFPVDGLDAGTVVVVAVVVVAVGVVAVGEGDDAGDVLGAVFGFAVVGVARRAVTTTFTAVVGGAVVGVVVVTTTVVGTVTGSVVVAFVVVVVVDGMVVVALAARPAGDVERIAFAGGLLGVVMKATTATPVAPTAKRNPPARPMSASDFFDTI